MNELALFAGAGGGILGGLLLGWRTVAAVEIEEYCRAILLQRQADGILPQFPIWDDVRTFDGRPWRGKVDVVSGGFPCQDISCAGKGGGITGVRSGLWNHMARIISEVQPRYVFVENVAMLVTRGLDRVLYDFAQMGYYAEWGTFSGRFVGAPIERKRIFIAGAYKKHGKKRVGDIKPESQVLRAIGKKCPPFWLQAPPVNFGMEHGVDNYVDQVKAIGNGQIPAMVALAWKVLNKRIVENANKR